MMRFSSENISNTVVDKYSENQKYNKKILLPFDKIFVLYNLKISLNITKITTFLHGLFSKMFFKKSKPIKTILLMRYRTKRSYFTINLSVTRICTECWFFIKKTGPF